MSVEGQKLIKTQRRVKIRSISDEQCAYKCHGKQNGGMLANSFNACEINFHFETIMYIPYHIYILDYEYHITIESQCKMYTKESFIFFDFILY